MLIVPLYQIRASMILAVDQCTIVLRYTGSAYVSKQALGHASPALYTSSGVAKE